MEELITNVHDVILISLGVILGLLLGFVIWHRRRNDAEAHEQLSKLQSVGIALFLAYWASPIMGIPRLPDVIGLGILAIIIGEKTGVVFAQVIEHYWGKTK